MAKDLRTFLEVLEKNQHMIRAKKPVDPREQMSALAWEALPDKAVFFESLAGFPDWQAVAGTIENRQRAALAVGVTPDRVLPEYSKLWDRELIPYQEVSQGPVKEVVLTGKDVNLLELPIPKNCERDGGPYLTFSETICRDPDTGVHNAAILRIQIKSETKTGIYCVYGKHTWEIYRKYERMNQPMPVAITIGHHPAMHLAGTWAGPMDVDELNLAGTIMGEPLPVVKAETSDLMVPADAEAVIEGLVPPGYREEEGPHAEFTGYYPRIYNEPIIEVKAITRRKKPIYDFNWSAHPGVCTSLGIEGYLYNRIKEVEGYIDIKDVYIFPQVDHFLVIVQFTPHYEGQAKNVLMAALSGATIHTKVAMAVDEDVNIYDPADILWALANRTHPKRDVFIIGDTRNHPFDIKLPLDEEGTVPVRVGSKMGIDATKPPTTKPDARQAFDRARPVGWDKVKLADFL
jgi:2,5-furandicarboxylate decarboxylase 1